MLQHIQLSIKFGNLGFRLRIENVFELDDKLIVIAKIYTKEPFEGGALFNRGDSTCVTTKANKELPVSYFALLDGVKHREKFISTDNHEVTVIKSLADLSLSELNPLTKISSREITSSRTQ